MFSKLLIAHRGTIACRILRTLRTLNVHSVTVHTEADITSLHVRQADQSIHLGDEPATSTYLAPEKIIDAAKHSGATAILPGDGYLSDNPAFAEACAATGITFIGPTPEQLRIFGSPQTARALSKAHQLPLLEQTDALPNLQAALEAANTLGYPVILKHTTANSTIRICQHDEELASAFNAAHQCEDTHCSQTSIVIEQYIAHARHLAVQIFGDGKGDVIALGIRDNSVQRHHHTILIETPASDLPDEIELALCEAAIRLCKAVHYRSAGTVEFVYDNFSQRFYFLAVKTHLQMEHSVTEQVWRVDLVRWMIKLAAGDLPPLSQLKLACLPAGHAIQAQLYAEDPGHDFRPSAGLLTNVSFPKADDISLRIETCIETGCTIPAHFDQVIASPISWSLTRETSRTLLHKALAGTVVYGVESNHRYIQSILEDKLFREGALWTRYLEGLTYTANTCDIIDAGTHTTIQDYPGRQGLRAIGIPPSGPMDDLALRLGNRLLNNEENTVALEITLHGPTLTFNTNAIIAITGAPISALLDDVAIALHTTHYVAAGSTLSLGSVTHGARSYLCFKGGIQVPDYLGSKSTFTTGQFGGHAGRALLAGDVLHLSILREPHTPARLHPELYPTHLPIRALRVISGPHYASMHCTPSYIDTFLATDWEVHADSNRTSVRLIGAQPEAPAIHNREDVIHAIGTLGAIDCRNSMPSILGPDAISQNGIYPLAVIEADLWQLGQLKAGDKVRFIPVDLATARNLVTTINAQIQTQTPRLSTWRPAPLCSPIMQDIGGNSTRLVVRLSGDTHLLLETGTTELDLPARLRLHALMQALEQQAVDGILDITSGVQSLLLHYQPEQLPLHKLLTLTQTLWEQVTVSNHIDIPSRIIHLPLSWDDPACRLATEKYMTSVNKDTSWCPSNLEFIRCSNGLSDLETVKRIVFDASYLVLSTGNTYSGAPITTALDPRHRLLATPYTPARTWTAENSVGMSGACLGISSIPGPGHEQLIGRTLQMWNSHQKIAAFNHQPSLLNTFDQIRFYPVSAETLVQIRKTFPLGHYPLTIEHTTLNLAEYEAFLVKEADSIATFQSRQRIAFNAEQQRSNNVDLHTLDENDHHNDDHVQWYG